MRVTTISTSLPSSSPKPSPPDSPFVHRGVLCHQIGGSPLVTPRSGGILGDGSNPQSTSKPGPRSVSWSLPSQSLRGSISQSFPYESRGGGGPLRFPSQQINSSNNNLSWKESIMDPHGAGSNQNTEEFLSWRRLELSKAKLSGITEMAALMAGFSVVATVELQINDDADPVLLTAFTVVTAILVCTTMMAIMISTCILPHIQVVSKMESQNCSPNESPHDKMMWYIDCSWVLANTLSIFLFTLDVILLCWIKFTYFSETASIAATCILSSVLIAICAFGIIFYRQLVKFQYAISDRKYQELEEMRRNLENSSFVV